jgi:RNA-binding protein VTS1
MTSSPPVTTSTPTLRASLPRHHGHHLRASADLSAFHSPLTGRNTRPNSEIYLPQHKPPPKPTSTESPPPPILTTPANPGEQLDEWERELQHYEATLEEMASASLDMKEELGAVEQWFRVLTEAERTAALYSLLQQATQVQIRFFLTVLQQMASKTPVNHLLSPASFEKGIPKKLNGE